MKKSIFAFFLSFTFSSIFAQLPPNYYSSATGLTGAALKSQLKSIITNGHIDKGYNSLLNGFQSSDKDYFYENDGTVLDMYSENPTGSDPYNFNHGTNTCGSYSNEGDCYNREHIIPQSLFNQNLPMRSDIHFVTPTDGKVNGMRSNYPFGKVGTASFTSLNGSKLGSSVSSGYSGTVFEPIDEFKGDVARMIFYFVTRYETQIAGFSSGNILGNSAYPGLQVWELNQLLSWNTLDPVSSFEIARNNASYVYQGNRNPYIDNPGFVNLVWGSTTIDTQAPSAPLNLVASNPTANTIALGWTASTDNISVTGYDVYVNGVLKATVSGINTTIQNLNPATTYNFYIIAKDAAGNLSTQSNVATGTTLEGSTGGTVTCGTEDFSNIPSTSTSTYSTQTWTSNNIMWTATDARIDETITGKAITVKDGSLTSSAVSGGIQSLTVKTQLKYSGTANNLNVEINGVLIGTIPYSSTVATTTINNINILGSVVIKLINPISGNRVAIDDLSWTCAALSAEESSKTNIFTIYPNPAKNQELFIRGENLKKFTNAKIYDFSGKLILNILNPFKSSNKIDITGFAKGTYMLILDGNYSKFIVD
ncbi:MULTISPECIES: endonuclease [Chryseobacterium group]|uniref:endonuclease n=1 Tax=Chryseobacterium group TaxID=2782232 RepID=UPI000425D1AB|nr:MULTISPECIES: endonuclease [Chryseobacterium group]HBV17537.1 T9SS C-terminal target domain-containing protein [Chryseobacterium carnipullorum]